MIRQSVQSFPEASVGNEFQILFAIFTAASIIPVSKFRGALPVADESFRAHLKLATRRFVTSICNVIGFLASS